MGGHQAKLPIELGPKELDVKTSAPQGAHRLSGTGGLQENKNSNGSTSRLSHSQTDRTARRGGELRETDSGAQVYQIK